MTDLVPKSFWTFPSFRVPSIWDEDEDMSLISNASSGLSISEDEENVYVEAAVPGIDPENVDITFDKGTLWIKGEKKQEEENKKYYRKASRAFSYRVTVPGELDQNHEPEATYKNGVMTVKFAKSPKSQPKKIAVRKTE